MKIGKKYSGSLERVRKNFRDTANKTAGAYPREQPRQHSTSTEKENTNPHYIGTTPKTHPPNPTRSRPQKPGDHNPHTTRPPKDRQMQDIARCRTSPLKADSQGSTQTKEDRYNNTGCPKRKRPTSDLTQAENDCIHKN